MQRRLLLLSLASASIPFHARSQNLQPKSFATQIKQNSNILETSWSHLINDRDGTWKKIYATKVDIDFLDVVKGDSLLHPYIGKLTIRMNLVHSESVTTEEEAKTINRDANRMINPMQYVNTILDLQFTPKEKAWQYISGRSKNSVSAMLGDSDWITLNSANLRAGPMGSISDLLSAPIKSGKNSSPLRKQITT